MTRIQFATTILTLALVSTVYMCLKSTLQGLDDDVLTEKISLFWTLTFVCEAAVNGNSKSNVHSRTSQEGPGGG